MYIKYNSLSNLFVLGCLLPLTESFFSCLLSSSFSLFLGVTASCRAIRVKSSPCCGLYSSIPNAFLILPPPCQGMSAHLCSTWQHGGHSGQRSIHLFRRMGKGLASCTPLVAYPTALIVSQGVTVLLMRSD